MSTPDRSVMQNLRDLLNRFVPSWLSDRYPDVPSYGFRLLWVLILFVDGAIELVFQGSLGAIGQGSPSALPYVGQARGLIRNQDESDDDYSARLPTWIERAKENGSSRRLALAIHDYLRSHPRIRFYKRNGECFTVETDRTITQVPTTAWDWDSVSHPERNTVDAPWWSDLFVVVYTTSGSSEQWPVRAETMGTLTDDGLALGHMATHREIDDIKGLVQLCKAAHTCIRAIIWTSDETLFVPTDPASMPDGTWGAWSVNSGGHQIASGRDLTTCRYWEPR